MIRVQTLEIQSSSFVHHSAAISCFWSLPFIVCCRNGADSAQGRCVVGGRYTPFLMIAAISRKKGTHTQDSRTITKAISFGIKNGPCETLSFFFPFLSCSFRFLFPFPFLFLSFSFSFPFPFSFLFLSLYYSFLSLPLLFLFLFPFLAHVNSLIRV